MSFSVSRQGGKFEWGFSGLSALFADKTRIFSPAFYRMMWDILYFNIDSRKLLKLQDDDPRKHVKLGEFLKQNGYSKAFEEGYLLPITCSLWSSSTSDVRNFSALNVISFLHNHKMLQFFNRPQWLTCSNRSIEYVNIILEELKDRLELGNAVVDVAESPERYGWQIRDSHGEVRDFDRVIFACHADIALKLLGESASEEERLNLGAFKFSENVVYLHADQSLMPKRKATWSSWNYVGPSNEGGTSKKRGERVFITYWLNKLEHLKSNTNLFISLNPTITPSPQKIHLVKMMRHPQFTPEGERAQSKVRAMNGKRGAWFAGAWMGYGFHEDGLLAGLEAATDLTETPVPWVPALLPSSKEESSGDVQLVEPRPVIHKLPVMSLLDPLQPVRTIILSVVAKIAFWCIKGFLKRGIKEGYLSFRLPDGKKISYGDKSKRFTPTHVIIKVFDWNFFVRVALEFDLGFSKSYMAGEFIVMSNKGEKTGDSLARFFHMLCLNRGYEGKSSNSLYAGGHVATSLIGSTLNWLYLRLSLDNSISGSQSNISAHYDLSNDLFATFLDKEFMVYSSAIYDASLDTCGELQFSGSLESAEIRKIDTLIDRLNLSKEHHLLDVGFGWGGICIRAAERFGCRVTGITLSIAQKEEAERRVRDKKLSHLITFHLVDYRVFADENRKKFDRIVSCEMIEAVGHNYLRTYFESIDKLLRPDGIFVMEAITTPEIRYQEYLKSTDFISSVIFPGSCCPSLAVLLNAMAKSSSLSLEGFDNINLHYAQTLRDWRYRYRVNELSLSLSLSTLVYYVVKD